jgi:hypothetical protein
VLLAPSGAPDAEPDAPVVPTTTPNEASHDDELVEDGSRRRASEPFAIRTAV